MLKKLLLVAAAMVVATGSFSSSVQAQSNNNNQEDKVTICHRTDSATNPYVKITVDKSAADGVAGNSGGQADHFGEHKGPIATSQAVAQGYKDNKTEWGDIIPPVTGSHDGLNWTTQGQAIYNNDCKFASPVRPSGGNGETPSGQVTTGGRGGAGPQVQAVPTQSVNAGGGGGASYEVPAVGGLVGSLVAIGYGLARLRKLNF